MATIRARIETGFEKFGRAIFRNRIKTLLLMSILIAGFVSQLPKITFDTSNESYFRKGDRILEEYDAFRAQFGREEVIIIGISPPNIFDRVFLEKLTQFHEALEDEIPFVEEVTSLVNVRNTRGEGDELIVEDLLKEIPRTPQGIADLRTRVLGSTLYPNYLISEDGTFTTIIIEPVAHAGTEAEAPLEAGFDDDNFGAGDLGGDSTGDAAGGTSDPIFLTPEQKTAMDSAVRKVGARFEGPEFPLVFGGAPVMDVFFDAAMANDMGTFTGLAVLAIAIFLLVLFRRIAGMVLPLLVVILSLLSTIGLMAASGVPFTIPTTILPSFLLAVGVGASVHLLAIFFRDFQRHGDKEQAIAFALGHSGLPIAMTSVTTAAGLFAFMTSQMAPVAHLARPASGSRPCCVVTPFRPPPTHSDGQPRRRMTSITCCGAM